LFITTRCFVLSAPRVVPRILSTGSGPPPRGGASVIEIAGLFPESCWGCAITEAPGVERFQAKHAAMSTSNRARRQSRVGFVIIDPPPKRSKRNYVPEIDLFQHCQRCPSKVNRADTPSTWSSGLERTGLGR